jgi:transcriptional regulator with PAS, ATPase and Fis domain
VGKEVVANAIRVNSAREKGPFIKVNCAAIPATLLEAELFGYEKGAFTGATAGGKMGLFELADKGTLLLDEIGEMSLELQAKLLRVIQHKEVNRIGGSKPIQTDVRILSATHCELKELVRQNKFREDLYYRLNVFPIFIPPLRERPEDVALLVRHFLSMFNTKYGKSVLIDTGGMSTLQRYSWPGNVRELQNIVERIVIISEPHVVVGGPRIAGLLDMDPFVSDNNEAAMGLYELVEATERRMIEKALRIGGSTRKAAAMLKIDQSTIVKKAKKLGILAK